MRCISLWQPWAQLIVLGAKKFETRSWITGVRGRVAIHAAKKNTRELREFCEWPYFRDHVGDWSKLPLGAVIGTAELVACYRAEDVRPHISEQEETFGNYEDGRFCWRFKEPVLFQEPIFLPGFQGFFEVDDDLIRRAA